MLMRNGCAMAVKARAGSVRNKAATASAVKRVSCFGVTTLQLLFILCMLAMDQSSSLDLDRIRTRTIAFNDPSCAYFRAGSTRRTIVFFCSDHDRIRRNPLPRDECMIRSERRHRPRQRHVRNMLQVDTPTVDASPTFSDVAGRSRLLQPAPGTHGSLNHVARSPLI
jgi:hypothetical protein